MRLLRPRKATASELRRDELRKARIDAPTLRQLLPAAELVRVEIAFDGNAHLADAPRTFTVYPPAQAHFVYVCPFGDCDGTHDLNEEVNCMLRTGTRRVTGARHCLGHRARRSGPGPQCNLGATYAVTILYAAELSREMQPPSLAR